MKNQFDRPKLYDHAILDEDGLKIGEIRVTPTAIKWRGKGRRGPTPYRSISLDEFIDWMESSDSGARDTKR